MRTAISAMLVSALYSSAVLADDLVAPAEPQRCVFLANIRETRVIDNMTIDFIMNNGQVLRNNLPNSCPQLGANKSFGYETSQSQLCNVDIITVIVQGGGPRRGASCSLGQFTPVPQPVN